MIQSVERALNILGLFDESKQELRIKEISDFLNIKKNTIHSLLKTLKAHGYIEQNPDNDKYRLGLKLIERANSVTHNLDLRSITRPHLLELSLKTDYTLHLVILDGKEGVYIDKVEGESSIVVYSRIGKRIPIHSSGVGKVLTAFKNEQELKILLKDYYYKKQTKNTITSEEGFLNELGAVAEKGYAIDYEENESGICCLAVPLKNYTGETVAAISLSIPTPKLTTKEQENIIPILKTASNTISKQLGYTEREL